MNNDQPNLFDQVRKQDDKDSVAPINDSPSAPSANKKSYPPQSDQPHLPQPQHQHPNNQHDQQPHPQQTPAAITSQSSSSTSSSSVVPAPFSSSPSSLSSSSLQRGDGVTVLDGANKKLEGVIGQIVKGPFKYDDPKKPNKEWYQVFVLDGTFHDEVQGVDRKPGHLCILPAASLIQKTSNNSYADKRSGNCDQCQRNHTTDCLTRTDVIHEASMLVNNTSTLGLPRIREVLFLCSRCATNKLMSPKPSKPKSKSKNSSKKATHEIAKTPPNWEVGKMWLGVYEKCTVLNETESTYDVQIVSDGGICKDVLKLYVRRIEENLKQSSKKNSKKRKGNGNGRQPTTAVHNVVRHASKTSKSNKGHSASSTALSSSSGSSWLEDEIDRLKKTVESVGYDSNKKMNWNVVANFVSNRTAEACRKKYSKIKIKIQNTKNTKNTSPSKFKMVSSLLSHNTISDVRLFKRGEHVRVKWSDCKWYNATIDTYFKQDNTYDVVFDDDNAMGKIKAKHVITSEETSVTASLSFPSQISFNKSSAASSTSSSKAKPSVNSMTKRLTSNLKTESASPKRIRVTTDRFGCSDSSSSNTSSSSAVSKKKPKKISSNKSDASNHRRRRCGVCQGCTVVNCEQCKYCLNRPRNGGQGTFKKACVMRVCTSFSKSNSFAATTSSISSSSSSSSSDLNNKKGQWSSEEEKLLIDILRKAHAPIVWSQIALQMPRRNAIQCREQWHNHLDPTLKQGQFSEEEDVQIIRLQKEHGNNWQLISELLGGRGKTTINTRWHKQLKHRVEEERKNARINSATHDEPSTNGAASISKKRELNSSESSSSSVVAGNERPSKKAKTNMDANQNSVDAAVVLSSDAGNKNELKGWFLSLGLGSKGIELFDLLWMEGIENMEILRQVDDGMLKEIGIKLVQRGLLMKAISKLSPSSLSV
jgi:hypothetical protein